MENINVAIDKEVLGTVKRTSKQALVMWRNVEESRRKETTKNEARKYKCKLSEKG